MGTMADAITSSLAKWERKPADFYPTPVDGTNSLVPVLQALDVHRVWEPACGDGRLSRVLDWHGFDVISTDLREHSGFGYGGLDFLTDTPASKWGWLTGDVDAIVTNPPFALAEPFIRRARSLAPTVVMLLKATYWNTQGRIALFDEHKPAYEFKLTWRLPFLEKERGKSPLMDCIWVVWNDEARLSVDGHPVCLTEPMPKVPYPGYRDRGLSAALDILAGEFGATAEALSTLAAEVTSDG